MKEFWCDLETTGLNPYKHAIWQMAFIIVDGTDRVEMCYTMRPTDGDAIDPKALDVGGIDMGAIKALQDPREVFADMKRELRKWVDPYNKSDKMLFYGYNADFDARFLRRLFEKMGDKYYGSWFWTPAIDVMSLAAHHLRDKRDTMLNFKLYTVAEKLGIDVEKDKLHNALYDIQITRVVLKKIERR